VTAVKASIMITCLGDLLFPEVGVAMVTVLRRLGVTVDFHPGQTCCGMPLFNSGFHDDAARVAARTVRVFEQAEHVVVPSGSCAWMVKTEYPGLLKHDGALRAAAERLAGRTRELSQFLVEVLGVTRVESDFKGRVTYHDSCHLLRGLGLPGVELRELPGADQCCGFGGSFSVRLPEVSTAILDKKLASVEATDADCLVACDGGCLMQIGGGLSRRGSRVRALHLAQILAGGTQP
jgi:L-lactate dehydrogenase complex protein LldE